MKKVQPKILPIPLLAPKKPMEVDKKKTTKETKAK